MQNFVTKSGKAYSFDDDVEIIIEAGVSSAFTAAGVPLAVPDDLTPCAGNQLPGPSAAQKWAAYQGQAQALLDKTDMVALRCWKAGVAFPADWQSATMALRAIAGASSGDPTQPLPTLPTAYPAET